MSIIDLAEGVRPDGTIDDPYQGVETYYQPVEAVFETEHFLRVIIDDGATNIETRILIADLERAGWIRPSIPLSERSDDPIIVSGWSNVDDSQVP